MTVAYSALDNVLEVGRTEELSAIDIIDRLLDIELKALHQRRIKVNYRLSGLPYRRSLKEFDFSSHPFVDE